MLTIIDLWADKWAGTIWTVTWQGALFAAFVFLVTGLFRKQLTPTVRHLLWILVIAKFLITPFVAVPITVKIKAVAPPPVVSPVVKETAGSSVPFVLYQSRETLHPSTAVFLLWLFGVMVFLLVIAARSVRIYRQMSSAKPLEDKDILAAVERGAGQLGIRPPGIRMVEKFSGPFVYGFLRPVLVIPERVRREFRPEELEAIILHELAHIKRKDILTNWLQTVALMIYFFNPVMWYVNRQIRLEREQACDDWVLQVNQGGRKSYAETLLKVIDVCVRPNRFALNIVGVSEIFTLMSRRLAMIMDTGRRLSTTISRKALLALLAVGVLAIPAYSVKAVQAVADNPPAVEKPLVAATTSEKTQEVKEVPLSESIVIRSGLVRSDGVSSVFIENRQTGKTSVYKVVDEIAIAKIVGAKISRIEAGEGKVVLIDKEGKEVVLALQKPEDGSQTTVGSEDVQKLRSVSCQQLVLDGGYLVNVEIMSEVLNSKFPDVKFSEGMILLDAFILKVNVTKQADDQFRIQAELFRKERDELKLAWNPSVVTKLGQKAVVKVQNPAGSKSTSPDYKLAFTVTEQPVDRNTEGISCQQPVLEGRYLANVGMKGGIVGSKPQPPDAKFSDGMISWGDMQLKFDVTKQPGDQFLIQAQILRKEGDGFKLVSTPRILTKLGSAGTVKVVSSGPKNTEFDYELTFMITEPAGNN